VIRPNHTSGPPPGPSGHRPVSIPLGTTVIRPSAVDHAAAVWCETAANRVLSPAVASIADSNHGVGGVCTVVSIGTESMEAIATGR
jgi:hypothetical protein